MKKFYLFSVIFLITIKSNSQWIPFDQTGLLSQTVYNLSNKWDTGFASANDGLYAIDYSSLSWSPLNFQGQSVYQTMIVNDSTIIALVEIDSSNTTQI